MFLLNPQARKVYLKHIENSANNIEPKWIGSHGISDDNLHAILDRNFRSIKGETFQEKLDTLNKCKCCQRHREKRLTIYQPFEELFDLLDLRNKNNNLANCSLDTLNFDRPIISKYNFNDPRVLYQGYPCDCDCRQISRFICRQFPRKWEDRKSLPNEGKADIRCREDLDILGHQFSFNKLDNIVYGNDNLSLTGGDPLHNYSDPVLMNIENLYRSLLDNKMKFLTKKYHPILKKEINNLKFHNIFYIAFDANDFILPSENNFEPQKVLIDWLSEILNPHSKYLPFKKEEAALGDGFENISGEKDHFGNLNYKQTCDLFTIQFKYYYKVEK